MLSLLHVFMGRSFLDSGFYLYAAKLVYQGQIPYRDFFFVQPPLYPYIYGLVMKIAGVSILTARLTSMLFGIVTLILAVHLARRIGGLYAGFITAGLLGFNVFLSYNFSVSKLYALTAFFLTAGTVFLSRYAETGRGICMPAFLLALTTGTRIALFPLAAVFFLYLLLHERKISRSLLAAFAVYLITTAVIFLPFLVLAGTDVVYYHLVGIHASADASGPYHFGMMNKIAVLSKLVRENFVIVFLFIAACFLKGTPLPRSDSVARRRSLFFSFYLPAVLAVYFLVHFAANWFTTDYLTVIFPLAAVWTGYRITRVESLRLKFSARIGCLFLLGCLMGAFAYGKRDIMFHEGSFLSPYFPSLAAYIPEHVPPGGKLAVLNPLIAIQSGRDVVHGFEGMPPTYTPEWSDEKCARFNSVNNNRLKTIFRDREAAALVIDGEIFGIAFPRFVPVPQPERDAIINEMKKYYRKAATFPPFVSGGSDVEVYLPD